MKRILITVCFLSLFFSCSNDDESHLEILEENFYALTVGNSWEYRWYNFTPQGGLHPTNITESISIIETENINNNLYYKYKKVVEGNTIDNIPYPDNGEYFEYYRDSLGYLINELGDIKFVNSTSQEFIIFEAEFINDIVGYAQMSSGNFEFTTEAGTFDCLEMRIRYEDDDVNTDLLAVNKHYYADGIGLIKDEVVFISSPDGAGHQRRLESYDIQ